LFCQEQLTKTTLLQDYITHANSLSVLKSSLSNFYMYHVNSKQSFMLLDMLLLAHMWLLH